jgi:starch phosphorylase
LDLPQRKQRETPMKEPRSIAYFSMEIALEAGMPTYSGGLGVLAGDTLRSAADLHIPLIAVTLLHRRGYFYQRLDASGGQREEPIKWVVDDFCKALPQKASVTIEGRNVSLRVWKYEVKGIGGYSIPVYLLDSDLLENHERDRKLTDVLYGGDPRYRLAQEVILGMGGMRMLRALGYDHIERFHMNEGHSSLLTLELLNEEQSRFKRSSVTLRDTEAVRKKCVFTTHTPVAAGHDQFPMDLVHQVMGHHEVFAALKEISCCEGLLNLTFLALNLSGYVNGVAKKHGEVSRLMFSNHQIDAITNGVHAATWSSGPFQRLYDRYIPGWRQDNFSLRYALSVPKEEIWQVHREAKRELIGYVNRHTNVGMDVDLLTIGFARRATAYKRWDLVFMDLDRLVKISRRTGPFQIVYSGKAHPRDEGGKELIRKIFQFKQSLQNDIKITYLENYGMEIGKLVTSGVDVWLNTPQPPMEASGTSGMKAALNGVPSLRILDGWWIEGHIEGITGWSIGENTRGTHEPHDSTKDALSLYQKLEEVILPLFYNHRDRFVEVMRQAIAINGSFFNTQRMLQQYVMSAYFR